MYGEYLIEPNLHGQIAWEKQDGYTTSGRTVVASQNLTIGKIAFGPRISRDHLMESGTIAEFWTSIEGEYDFLNGNEPSTSIDLEGQLSARISAGVDFDLTNDLSLEIDGNIGGIGIDDYTTYQGNIRLSVPF